MRTKHKIIFSPNGHFTYNRNQYFVLRMLYSVRSTYPVFEHYYYQYTARTDRPLPSLLFLSAFGPSVENSDPVSHPE